MEAPDMDILATVQAGYHFEGPVVELGALVVAGTSHPEVTIGLPLSMMTRHGLVAGATGTGKTKTLQLMAEQLSAAGVPVFLSDIKGDVSGMAAPGQPSDRISKRAADVGIDWQPGGCPVEFYGLGGSGAGAVLRATVTSFGPLLLAKVLGLNAVQESSLGLVFHYADKAGLPLLDLKDLRALISFLTSEAGASELAALGGLSKATAGVILRELIAFSDQGAEAFFGEPEFDTADLLRCDQQGNGIISMLELAGMQDKPALFSTFLMWLLADLFHDLPEVGDVDKPKLVFFFDEAHLLFADASKDFLQAIAQTVRLIRSKGVGIFFVTQTPTDVPDEVLAQLGNRVQHALRAFTPADAKALKATVSTFPHSGYDLAEVLPALGIGEAVVTVLSDNGAPTPVAWTRLAPPRSLMGPLDPAVLSQTVATSPIAQRYAQGIDRDSAYERLLAKLSPAEGPTPGTATPGTAASSQPGPSQQGTGQQGTGQQGTGQQGTGQQGSNEPQPDEPDQRHSAGDIATGILGSTVFKSFARSAASAAGREISRSLFGIAPRRRTRRR